MNKKKKKTIIFSGQSLRVTATALGIPFHLWIPKMKSSSLLLWKCSRQNCLQFWCIMCVMHNISLSHAQMQQLATAPPFVGMWSKSNLFGLHLFSPSLSILETLTAQIEIPAETQSIGTNWTYIIKSNRRGRQTVKWFCFIALVMRLNAVIPVFSLDDFFPYI